ncbi:hypothetical protein Btru_038330 [Bulinus truncatus]|nr:hypothetical protein Btru_038330 [Bulinus truncatus]
MCILFLCAHVIMKEKCKLWKIFGLINSVCFLKRQKRLWNYLLYSFAGMFTVYVTYCTLSNIALSTLTVNNYQVKKNINNLFSVTGDNTGQSEGSLTDILFRKLQDRLTAASNFERVKYSPTCSTNESIGSSCLSSGCLRMKMPRTVSERIQQIILPSYMGLSLETKKLLETMAANVSGYYEITVVSAVSSNHFLEAQAMLYNIHNNLFPYIKNFTFVVYDIGLTLEERRFIGKICKCHLIDFPFCLLPKFMAYLHCYTWKAIIVNAHIARTNVLIWADASVRFHQDPRTISNILNEVKTRGIQLGSGRSLLPHHTLPSMFHYFQDEPCMYLPYHEAMSGMIVSTNDPLVRMTILEPWAACALNESCMCPTDRKDLEHIGKATTCRTRKGQYHYGVCHRFDQSAISILIAKLYQEYYTYIVRNYSEFWEIRRKDKMNYPIVDQ